MVFGDFLAFGGSRVGSILRPRTFIIFVYVSNLSFINLNIFSWLDNTNIDQHMTEILLIFVTNPTNTLIKGSTLSGLCQKRMGGYFEGREFT